MSNLPPGKIGAGVGRHESSRASSVQVPSLEPSGVSLPSGSFLSGSPPGSLGGVALMRQADPLSPKAFSLCSFFQAFTQSELSLQHIRSNTSRSNSDLEQSRNESSLVRYQLHFFLTHMSKQWPLSVGHGKLVCAWTKPPEINYSMQITCYSKDICIKIILTNGQNEKEPFKHHYC